MIYNIDERLLYVGLIQIYSQSSQHYSSLHLSKRSTNVKTYLERKEIRKPVVNQLMNWETKVMMNDNLLIPRVLIITTYDETGTQCLTSLQMLSVLSTKILSPDLSIEKLTFFPYLVMI